MIIDANNLILGRLGTFVAKKALLGEKIDIVNCENCVVTGNRKNIFEEYDRSLHRGAPATGPFTYRRPDRFVKRTIRGMLPFKRARGREAFKNIKCHIGVPEELKNEKPVRVESAGSERLGADYLKVKEICRAIGGKI